MNPTNGAEADISFSDLMELTGHQLGVADIRCPACGPDRRSTSNRRRKVMRVWTTTPSFASYHCARCGLDGHARQDGTSPPNRSELAKARAQAAQFAAVSTEKRRERARWLWRLHQPVAGSIAEIYLRECRGYRGPLPATLGFLPARGDFPPAMIAAFGVAAEPEPGETSISPAAVMAIHITRLARDGSGKAGTDSDKIMIGAPSGSPIALAAAAGDLAGLAITEGIEDALSVHEATGLGAWAAGSASFLPALATAVPSWMGCVTIIVDDDDAGRKHSEELAIGLGVRGFEVRLVIPRSVREAV